MSGYVTINEIIPGDYLGEQYIIGNGKSQEACIPKNTHRAVVGAEGGPVFVAVNRDASPLSGTHVPKNGTRVVGPYNNMNSLGVWARWPTTAHIAYGS